MKSYDIIVIGAGHAGIEAAYAAARLGCAVLLLTINRDTIGKLSCNPAVGGIAKGNLVREVDVLGGLIAQITDNCALGYRILNRSKGQAVWSTRAQVDKFLYPQQAQYFLETAGNVNILQAEAACLLNKGNKITGVRTNFEQEFKSKAVIVCAGTFLQSTIHIGMASFSGGRLNEPSSDSLFKDMRRLGFKVRHFKTGTCARLDRRSIDFSQMQEQPPDSDVVPFSFRNTNINDKRFSCYITHTNKKTHAIIRANLKYSPLYSGKIKSIGVRYCPSLEDKIVKFSQRDRHQIFVEPEGGDSFEVYPNGISTSLPFEVQIKFIRSISGFEKAEIIRPGYGIEHGVIDPRQLEKTLESKTIKGLYFAGQVNGTTGYEEAAAQGLVAGVNAAFFLKKKKPLIVDRQVAYIGVMIDDLTSKGVDEPYRMFTSRSEFRISLRETASDLHLAHRAKSAGLINSRDYQKILYKKDRIDREIKNLKSTKLVIDGKKIAAADFLKRPDIRICDIKKHLSQENLNLQELREVEIEIKYEHFLQREQAWAKDMLAFSKIKIPPVNYAEVPSLSREIVQKLERYKPKNLDEALKISGVTPASIISLFHYIRKLRLKREKN